MVTVDMFYVVCYALLIAGVIGWYIEHVKENAGQLMYWRGRKDGYDLHRRMINNKAKTDEVFDYDKN